MQFPFDGDALAYFDLERRIVKAEAPAVFGLGAVHGQAGGAQEFLVRRSIGGKRRHAHARAQGYGMSGGFHRTPESGQDPVHRRSDLLAPAATIEHDDELIAAEARQQIGVPQQASQAAGRLDQDAVPGPMAESFIGVLEAVQRDEQDGQLAIHGAMLGDGQAKAVMQTLAVEQAGEVVMLGHVHDPKLSLLPRRDVLARHHEMTDPTRGIGDRHHGLLHRVGIARPVP